MKSTLNKLCVVITGMLMAVTAQVQGETTNTALPCEPDCCDNQKTECNTNCNPSSCCDTPCCNTQKVENTPCCNTPCCCDPCCNAQKSGLILKGDLLYWRGSLCGLEGAFGTTTIETTLSGTTTTTTTTESDQVPDFKWNFGFRVGADLLIHCYDIEADWTHYHGSAHYTNGSQHGNWKLKYDTIDLTFGRRFTAAPCFTFRPFIGVRGAEIHQTLKSYLVTTSIDLGEASEIYTHMDDKEDFWGLGPEVGIEADWYLGCNFSLYGTVDAVAYYGHVDGKNYDTDTFPTKISVNDWEKQHCFNTFATDASIGIRWDKTWCFCACEMAFMLKLGAEQHRIYDFSDLGSDGSLSLDGGIVEAGVGFRY